MLLDTLKDEVISIDDLLLDPNNPRLREDLNFVHNYPDDVVEELQNEIIDKMIEKNRTASIESYHAINELLKSIKQIGFIGIDIIVVRPLKNSKYIVIEGNRRITAIKTLLNKCSDAINNNRFGDGEDEVTKDVYNTLLNINTKVIDTDSLNDEEVHGLINQILGIRHHGSLLEWGPLPKAFHTYQKYMSYPNKLSVFQWNQKRAAKIAEILSISISEVKKKLQTYIVLNQLKDSPMGDFVKDKYYSLIEYGVGLSEYFDQDQLSFEFSALSLEKLYNLCQFDIRDKIRDRNMIILRDPKSFLALKKIVQISKTHEFNDVRQKALGELEQIESTSDMSEKRNVEDILKEIKELESDLQWCSVLKKLLDKRQKQLTIESFDGDSNQQLFIKSIKGNLDKIKRVLGVK
jgi:hypothetical protein